ncbi:hypothetical protein BU23DRAFT_566965 [Bimuria novae-zelandiae CBS 107.79]|uniref:UBA domain-containing protein n=1 Tax=Bimuria novae-zelandiae CBS 107.79 TaxID=1447943 RepID=A0A6A5VF16_9PLEO|nr:hypothetical protein BU23DRAFT_566965 [Bimuria novae-zelandiae CBS 107.79]
MRVIQDSEDEEDFEIEGGQQVAAAERDAPPNPDINTYTSPKSGEKGTGSTGSLRRAIVAAHRAQFRDSASSSEHQAGDRSNVSGVTSATHVNARTVSQDAPVSSPSLPDHSSKRRRTSLDGAMALSPTRDIFPVTNGKRHSGQADDSNNLHLGPTPEKPWNFQGTMRDDWEHHEPMGLFDHSVPSSTIPNATATQQLLLAEVLAPGFLDLEPEPDDAPTYEPAKSSVPWSEYLKSSARGSPDPIQFAEQASLSPNIACDPSEHLTGSRTSKEVAVEPVAPTPNPPSRPFVEPFSDDESAANQTHVQSSEHPIVSPPDNIKQKLSAVPESEDDLTIGLPTENYKPRPSRSRSLKLTGEDPIDHSKRPEASARKTRRTRTAGDVETASTATTPEKVQQICDMGFTPLSTKRALRQHNGDITQTVDWLIANGVAAGDELAPPMSFKPTTKRKSKRDASTQDKPDEASQSELANPVMQDPSLSADVDPPTVIDDVMETAPAHEATKSPTVVRVVIPRSKRPRILSEHEEIQAAAAFQHDPENDKAKVINAQTEEQPTAPCQAPKGKKRGRGRPKKESKVIEPIELERSAEKTQEPNKAPDEKPLEDTDKPEESMVAALDEGQTNKATETTSRPNATHTTPEPQPPPAKKAKQTNDAPSSIGKSKTPYRVGLSKRARIAPLLRIVKK